MASTTQPSADTDPRSGRQRPSQIQWVFPARLRSELRRVHVVGREEKCDTLLPGKETSRQHAAFRVDGPIVAVRDLESRNGVFLNGERVKDAPLQHGDVIRCGEWVGIVVAHALTEFREIVPGWYGSGALSNAVAPAARVSADLPIIVQGETGTGKEGLARAIHDWSRRGRSFIAVNCAALPVELAEAELFGFRKGAFTGAHTSQAGLFRAADGGSLFLDEILDLPTALQGKLLRVLQEGRVRAVGDTQDTPVDVRIIAATQEPLPQAVTEHRFRADLHARLDGLTLTLPPLRERREDIIPLFHAFAQQQGVLRPPELDAKFVEALCVYDWPLNVRELNLLTRRLLSVFADEPRLKKSHLPERIAGRDVEAPEGTQGRASAKPRAALRRAWRKTDDEAEFDALVDALRKHDGSVAKAAAALGLSRHRAYRVLSAHPEFSLTDLR